MAHLQKFNNSYNPTYFSHKAGLYVNRSGSFASRAEARQTTWICEKCEKGFATKMDLHTHRTDIHSYWGVKPRLYVWAAYRSLWTWNMQSFCAMATPIVNSLGASGYPALQNFLSQILDKKSRLFLLSSKKLFFVLLAATIFEMVEEVL